MWRQHNSRYFNAHQLIKPWEHELKMILRQMLETPLKEEKKQSKAKQYLVKLESYFPREKNGLGTRLCTACQFNLKSLFILDQVALHSVQFP